MRAATCNFATSPKRKLRCVSFWRKHLGGTLVAKMPSCGLRRRSRESFAVAAGTRRKAHLCLSDPIFHNCSRAEAEALKEFVELQGCFQRVLYEETHGQAQYNGRIASILSELSWEGEKRILSEIGLRCDFEKNGVWVEIEFGNARVYYQDYVKFLLASRHKNARLGILLCPTNAFAQLLCDLGQRCAMSRVGASTGRLPTYSGMMSHEKACRELPYLAFMLTSKLVLAGIEISSAQGVSA
jgi:hypothetical protein